MKTLYIIKLLILIIFFSFNNLYSQNFNFAQRAGSDSFGSDGDVGYDIAVDSDGDMYVVGKVLTGSSGATFGEGQINQTELFINGAFLAKYSSTGELEWVKEAGASNNSITAYTVGVDGNNDIYVAGTFYNTATFGAGELNETTLTGIAGEIFLAKYNSSGQLLWAKNIGGENDDNPGGRGLVIDNEGYCYLTGSFWGEVTFGIGDPNETTLTASNTDIFVAKYSTNGILSWVKKAGGENFDGGKSIDLDSNGNIIVTGNYFDYAVFGGGTENQTMLDDYNESAFITKYSSDGEFLWAIKPFVSGTGDISGGIAVDHNNNIVFTGGYFGTIIFGQGTSNELIIQGNGLEDIIIAKYDNDGNFIWADKAGSIADDRGLDVDIDINNNIFVTGYFGKELNLGDTDSKDTVLANEGSADIFIAKYKSDGHFSWAKAVGSEDWEQGSAIALDNSGKINITGFYRADIIFGENEENEVLLGKNGFNNIYLASFEDIDKPASSIIINQPQNISVCEGGSVTFSIEANGDNLHYQWKHNNKDILGANNSSFTIENVLVLDDGEYKCYVSNQVVSETSKAAKLEVNTKLTLTNQLEDVEICENNELNLTIEVVGNYPNFQWVHNRDAIEGQNSSNLLLSNVKYSDRGNYKCIVYNHCGQSNSNSALVEVNKLVVITEQPQSVMARIGESAVFSVSTNDRNFGYKWFKDGQLIIGTNNSSYSIENIKHPDAGEYICVVSGKCDSKHSDIATLTVDSNSQLNIYPVPTKDLITIELNELQENTVLKIRDQKGTILMQEKLTNRCSTLDISHLLKGVYFVEVTSKNNKSITRIIKE